MKLHISLRKNSSQREFIIFENVNPESYVADLKNSIAEKAELDATSIQLIYSCQPLCDGLQLKVLEEDGEDEKLIYVTLKLQNQKPETRKLSTIEQQQLVLLFRAALTNPNFRQILQNISKPESLNSLMASVPGLSNDQVAISMLHDWELLLQLAESKAVNTLAEKHPSVLDAINQVLASVPGIANPAALNAARRSQQPGRLARSLGADAEDESMEEDIQQGPLNQQAALGPGHSITPAQLAAALNLAQSSIRQSGSGNVLASQSASASSSLSQQSARSNPAPSTTNAIGGLTPELFSQALMQAMSQMSQPVPQQRSSRTSNTATSSVRQEEVQLREQFSRHLPQMRELGITDDSLSLRALQATNGDVEAAVNLIYAGLVDD